MKEKTDKRDAIYYLSEAVIFQRDMMKAKIAVWVDLIEDRVIAEIMSSTEERRGGKGRRGEERKQGGERGGESYVIMRIDSESLQSL